MNHHKELTFNFTLTIKDIHREAKHWMHRKKTGKNMFTIPDQVDFDQQFIETTGSPILGFFTFKDGKISFSSAVPKKALKHNPLVSPICKKTESEPHTPICKKKICEPYTPIEKPTEKISPQSYGCKSIPAMNAGKFNGFTVEQYGKGFLLIAPPGHEDIKAANNGIEEAKYYEDSFNNTGWWMKKNQAWFFKKEYLVDLLLSGAKLVADKYALSELDLSLENIMEVLDAKKKMLYSQQN